MDWSKFKGFTVTKFAEATPTGTQGQMLVPGSPIDLHELLLAVAEAPDGDWFDTDAISAPEGEAWPANAFEALQRQWICSPLIGFSWDSFGPMSWHTTLWDLNLEDGRSYICLLQEERRLKCVAALTPRETPATFAAFFRQFIAENGTGFGVEIFGSLPTLTENYRPDLLPQETVREAYSTWMAWAENEEEGVWLDLWQDVMGRVQEPDHLKRSLDLLRQLPAADAIDQHFADRAEMARRLSPNDKERIMGEYLAISYLEVPPKRPTRTRNRDSRT